MSRSLGEHNNSSNEGYSVIVCSLDYDGCTDPMGHPNSMPDIMRRMRKLLDDNLGAHLILMIGSARQTIAFNSRCEHSNNNGSCYTFMTTLLNTFKHKYPDCCDRIALDKLLLEDIHYNTPAGTHYELNYTLTRTEKQNRIDAISWQDEHKLAQLYAQIHYIATQYQHQNILFHFFDDREDILEKLAQHYSNNFIPTNIDLYCFQYSKQHRRLYFSVTGNSFIDFDYQHNVQHRFHQRLLTYTKTLENAIGNFQPAIAAKLYSESTKKDEIIKQCMQKSTHQFILSFINCYLAPEDRPTALKQFVLLLFQNKRYDIIQQAFSKNMQYVALAELCKTAKHRTDELLRKKFLHDLLMLFSKPNSTNSYYLDILFHLYYQQRALEGEIFSFDAIITIRTILYFCDKKTSADELIECILLSIPSVAQADTPHIPPKNDVIYQNIMNSYAKNTNEISPLQKKILELIDTQYKSSDTPNQNVAIAYRAFRLVILSTNLSSQSKLTAAIAHWKRAPTKIQGKNNWQLLEEADHYTMQNNFVFRFFNCFSSLSLHTDFIESLPIIIEEEKRLECTVNSPF